MPELARVSVASFLPSHFLVNIFLFAAAILKAGMLTGLMPAIAISFVIESFGIGARRLAQSESEPLLGSYPSVVSDYLLADPDLTREAA